MATDKECKCLKSVVRTVMDASALGELGITAAQFGNLKYRQDVSPVPSVKDVFDNISRTMKSLQSNINEFENNCDLSIMDIQQQTMYREGASILRSVSSKPYFLPTDARNVSIAGAFINDSIQDATSLKKLIRCE